MPSSPTSVQEQTAWGRKPIGDQPRPLDLGTTTGLVPTIVLLFDRTLVRIGDPTGGAPQSSREAAEEVRNREVKEGALKKGVAVVKHWEVFLDNLKATQMTACMSTNGLFLLLTSMLAFAKQNSKSMDRFDRTVRITGRRTTILLFSGLNSLSHHSRKQFTC